MIAQFDTYPLELDMSAQLTTKQLMTTSRRTISWHPPPLSVRTSPLFICDPFEDAWPNGDQSWIDTEPKPQRPRFAMTQLMKIILNNTTHVVNDI